MNIFLSIQINMWREILEIRAARICLLPSLGAQVNIHSISCHVDYENTES